MNAADVRWEQRFQNFCFALEQLDKFMQVKQLNELEEQGLIQSFEYNHELAWKVLKDFLQEQGVQDLFGSKNTTRAAFKLGLLGDSEHNGEVWMDMITSRNLTSHTYNKATTERIILAIKQDYYAAFVALRIKLSSLVGQ